MNYLFCRSNLPVAMTSGPGGPSYRSKKIIEKIPPLGGRSPWNERKDTNASLNQFDYGQRTALEKAL
jgi:hypothetical protein